MRTITILIAMDLAGQAKKKPAGEHAVAQDGYAMAALIVGMGIMALMMTVVMPVWKQAARREKEEELVFRGMQYVHAIGLYQRKFANAYPPNLDLLVDQKFLRKKFKDPITNDDFVILPPGAALPGAPVPGGQRGGTQPAGGIGSGGIGSAGSGGIGGGLGPGGPGGGAGAAAPRRRNSRRARSRAAAAASRRSDRSPAASAAAAPVWPGSRARARTNRFASTTAAIITTSGRSSTRRSCRRARPRRRHLGCSADSVASPASDRAAATIRVDEASRRRAIQADSARARVARVQSVRTTRRRAAADSVQAPGNSRSFRPTRAAASDTLGRTRAADWPCSAARVFSLEPQASSQPRATVALAAARA